MDSGDPQEELGQYVEALDSSGLGDLLALSGQIFLMARCDMNSLFLCWG